MNLLSRRFENSPVTSRSTDPEILDNPVAVSEHVRKRCYQELNRLHRWLGNMAAVANCLRRDPLPVRKVLDIGCAGGDLLHEIRSKLGIEGVGIDLHPPADASVPILRLDAVHESLPPADVAIAMLMTHHLPDEDVIRLIRNVSRSCRRFVILDLVRHPLPAFLFRMFVTPFVHRVTALDGLHSFERGFTVEEMKTTVQRALSEANGSFRHKVAPFYVRQIADISFGGLRTAVDEPGHRAGAR
jgi:SAM-dependent methyltransferase